MKKRRRVIIIFLIIVLVLAPKSKVEMSFNAKREFRNLLIRIKAPFVTADFQGPIIKKSDENKVVYIWHKRLPFNDTAWVNIDISRSRFKSPNITMNDGINYLTRKSNNLYEVFPSCENSSIELSEKSLDQLFKSTTPYTILNKEKLLTILEEGFYDVIKVNEELTFLIFWESFGIVGTQKNNVETKYSIVNLDDDCKVSLEPFLIPDSIGNCLVLKEDGYHYLPELRYEPNTP